VTPAGCDDAGFNEAVRAVLGRIHDSCSVAAGRPMSVVDMGLVLGWRLGADGVLAVEFCVTWGGCTMAPRFMGAAERDLAGLPGVARVQARVDADHVWDEGRIAPRPHRPFGAPLPEGEVKHLTFPSGGGGGRSPNAALTPR